MTVPSDVTIGEDFLGHALLVCDGLLEPVAQRVAVQGWRHRVEVAAGVSAEENAVG